MDTNKCAGDDNISSKFIREYRGEIAPILRDIFNKMVNNSMYPDILKVHCTQISTDRCTVYRVTAFCMVFNFYLNKGLVLRIQS